MGCGSSKPPKTVKISEITREMGLSKKALKAEKKNPGSVLTRQLSGAAAAFAKRAAMDAKKKPAVAAKSGSAAVAPIPVDPEIIAKDAAANAEKLEHLDKYKEMVRNITLFSDMGEAEIEAAAREVTIRHFKAGEIIFDEGDAGHEAWVLEEGKCAAEKYVWSMDRANKKEWKQTRTYKPGKFGSYFGEKALSRLEPRDLRIKCLTEVKAVRVSAHSFVTCARIREAKEKFIRGVRLFETMTDDQVIKLGMLMQKRSFKAGEVIVDENSAASHFFLLEVGQVAEMKNGSEVRRIQSGDIFADHVLIDAAPHAKSYVAVESELAVVAYEVSKEDFEAKLGALQTLQAEQRAADPRKLLADFYQEGDNKGPAGLLKVLGADKDLASGPSSKWFAVYRPCSRDSIAKMLGTTGVGKGLNIKGKSAKKGRLSGFVPFLQVSDNKHKGLIETSPKEARTLIFYRNVIARQTAEQMLQDVLRETDDLDIDDRRIHFVTDYEPQAFGLDIPEAVVREAYIMRPDLTQAVGWETGRASEPAFMDMNLHSVRGDSLPNVCLYQLDLHDPLNPHGLLIAYSEDKVKPVCSDFDTLTVGSRAYGYEGMGHFPEAGMDAVELMDWSLRQAEQLIAKPTSKGWMSRWLEVLKVEGQKGFHPNFPPFGFGDPTSIGLIGKVVGATKSCGAVRHGAECFNWYFPQDLDDEFLVVWDGFSNPPWKAHSEPELRQFLLERCKEGFSFPINPVWPIRDKGWYEVLQALKKTEEGLRNLESWFPPSSGLVERIEKLHMAHPDGFKVLPPTKQEEAKKASRLKSMGQLAINFADMSSLEMADFAIAEARGEIRMKWQRARNAFLFSNVLTKGLAAKKRQGGDDYSSAAPSYAPAAS